MICVVILYCVEIFSVLLFVLTGHKLISMTSVSLNVRMGEMMYLSSIEW